MTKNLIRKKTLILWLLIVVAVLILYFLNRDLFDISFLQDYVKENKLLVVAIYLFILSTIGFVFIPSTPFAIAGVLLFPPLEAYCLNLIGIFTSSTLVYHFTRYLRLNIWMEAKYPVQIKKIKRALSKKELPIIMGWSFFPVVPTDLIIYVSSTLNIPFWKCAFYIFSIDFFF